MTRRISDLEWQELSAYLDGQLSGRERVRLEKKLQQRVDLRSAYEDLQRVHYLLRSQPRLRAPRNFTLSAETAGISSARRPVPRRFPVFGLVSALASFMLVLVIAGEFLVGSPPMAAQPAAMEAAQVAQATEDLPMLQAEAETSSKSFSPQATPEMGLQAYPPADSGEASITAPQALEAAPMEYPAPEQPAEGEQQDEALSMTAEEDFAVEQDLSREDQPAGLPLFSNSWRTAQIILFIIALTSAAAAIFFWQKEHR